MGFVKLTNLVNFSIRFLSEFLNIYFLFLFENKVKFQITQISFFLSNSPAATSILRCFLEINLIDVSKKSFTVKKKNKLWGNI